MSKKSKLMFKPTPHCCDVALGNDWPTILCKACGTEYNADDITEIVLEIQRSGKRPTKPMNDYVRTRRPNVSGEVNE